MTKALNFGFDFKNILALGLFFSDAINPALGLLAWDQKLQKKRATKL